MSNRSSRLLAILAAVVVTSAVIGGVAVATPTGSAPATSNETANATVPHQNPDEVDEAGDDRRVAGHLSARLGDRLTESAIALSDGEYESGREPLGEEYGDLLEKYGVVASDLDEDELAREFNLTREQQRELAGSIEETDALVQEYQRAVENGNDERARELARELLETAAEVNETTTGLERQYAVLGDEAGVDLEEAEGAVEEIRRTAGEAAVAIEAREFTDSQLAVETNRTTVSTGEPVAVSGRLTTANGTAIDDGVIRVGYGDDTDTTRTNGDGTFEATYRPVSAPVNDSNLTVRYEPSDTDPYLPTSEVVSVRITDQADTAIAVSNATETVAFNETVRTAASVRVPAAADGRLDGIPLVLTASGNRIATAETDSEGQAVLAGQLPATVPAGERELRVAVDRDDLAVAASTASVPVAVQSTPTDLSADAALNATNQSVVASGRLTTADGTGISGRSVRVAVGGTDLGRAVTDGSGRYQATFTLPEAIERGDEPTLTATFSGTGTNLEESSDSQSLSLPAERSGSSPGSADEPVIELTDGVLIGIVSFALVALLVVAFRKRLLARFGPIGPWTGEPTEAGAAAASGSGSRSGAGAGKTDAHAGATAGPSLLERVRTALSAGGLNRAVQLAYAGVRAWLSSGSGPSTDTHREFYERRKRDDDIDTTRLKQITEAYEAAAFAPNDVSAETADEAVAATDELVDDRDGN
ncbi:Ig-like domain repeat protein [Halorubrum lipolyticum]|uniref:DUF4129 domain-containing protein n=1 Tax=Halorubrum lipolyticum DSM 21995 TaxID=1227482 RepID=M0NKP5_9EURY|nr:Ig-like domain repeat protein [Halorubrum lipolyticum]EMA58396.1 hypothetical protein C469_13175 [Halorubrum lipolyticum DSM 21995]